MLKALAFLVHNPHRTETSATAEIDGEAVVTTVPIFECELAPDGTRHGSLTLRFTGSQAAAAAEYFVAGRHVELTIGAPTAEDKPAPAPDAGPAA